MSYSTVKLNVSSLIDALNVNYVIHFEMLMNVMIISYLHTNLLSFIAYFV